MKRVALKWMLDIACPSVILGEIWALSYWAYYAPRPISRERLYELDHIQGHYIEFSILLSLVLVIPGALSLYWVVTRVYELMGKSDGVAQRGKP